MQQRKKLVNLSRNLYPMFVAYAGRRGDFSLYMESASQQLRIVVVERVIPFNAG